MPVFTIEKVTTEVSRERRAGAMSETFTLEVEGPAAQGGRNCARLVFGGRQRGGAVGYLVGADGAGVTLVGRLPAASLAPVRAALAAGGSLEVIYETREGQIGYLRRLGLARAGRALAAAMTPRPAGPATASFAMP